YNRGWLYAKKGDLQLAEKDYAKAIEINPKHENAYYNRGLLFVQIKKYERAVKDFSEVIKLNPRAVDAYCNRGSANQKSGRLDIAIQDYNAALKIEPDDGDLYYNRGVAYLAKGNKPKAFADFHKAANLGHNEARKYLNMPAVPKPSTPQTASPSSLRQVAIDCVISQFTDYMPSSTKMNVQRFETIRGNLEKNFSDLYQQAHQLFGERVQREGNQIRFIIKGEDPRWVEIFGPRWPEIIKQKPNEPRFLMIEAKFRWDQECRVIQRFQACLENPQACQDKPEENSALLMKKMNGSWQLVDGKEPKEWKQAFLFGEGLLEIVDWLKQTLLKRGKETPYEELMLFIAREYGQRIQDLLNKVSTVK
ncbi:MAG: tetratricopeptide repeat protein, partial [Pseudomonadota bacterium]